MSSVSVRVNYIGIAYFGLAHFITISTSNSDHKNLDRLQ